MRPDQAILATGFVPLAKADAETALRALGTALPDSQRHRQWQVVGRPVEVYPGAALLRLTDYSTRPPLRRRALHGAGGTELLDGTATPVLAFNARAGLRLDAGSVADYVRFFFAVVRDPLDPFTLVESADEIGFLDPPPERLARDLEVLVQPLMLTGTGAGHEFRLGCCFVFRSALLGAELAVSVTGAVRLFGETVLIERMPACAPVILR